jgi:hypothetical protein
VSHRTAEAVVTRRLRWARHELRLTGMEGEVAEHVTVGHLLSGDAGTGNTW